MIKAKKGFLLRRLGAEYMVGPLAKRAETSTA